MALQIAAENGDATLFNNLQHVAETSNNPQTAERALGMLAAFEDPALTIRTLEYATSGKVRNQDAVLLLAVPMVHRATQDAAWTWVTTHWPAVSAQLTELNGGAIVGVTSSFCSAEKAAEVKNFFSTHPVHASARTLTRAETAINDCVQFRAAQEANLASWLSAQNP